VRERLGVYTVRRLLGEGGMARVYLGVNTLVERDVAIKRLLPELAYHPEAHALLLREARTAGAIRHPNLLEVYDFGYDLAGRPYFVMELVEGETVASRLARGPLPVAEALSIAIAITDALDAVHREGYLHRDVKAENVMLGAVPKLIDFGIACRIGAVDAPDRVAGTPRVMAPEQVARERSDERTDLWGLGVLLHEMLTGALPFGHSGSLRDDMLAIVTEPPAPLPAGVSPLLRAIVGACLAKDPDGRPPCAATLAEALRRAHASLPR
jgi:serine/threonine-protein kinase